MATNAPIPQGAAYYPPGTTAQAHPTSPPAYAPEAEQPPIQPVQTPGAGHYVPGITPTPQLDAYGNPVGTVYAQPAASPAGAPTAVPAPVSAVPAGRAIVPVGSLGSYPDYIVCPHCNQTGLTFVQNRSEEKGLHPAILVVACLVFWPSLCCLLPIRETKRYVDHFCSSCRRPIVSRENYSMGPTNGAPHPVQQNAQQWNAQQGKAPTATVQPAKN